jgi:glycerol-3-phosphate dehydrogenase
MPGYGARYWADRTASARRRTYSKFRGSDTSDVVVIGGGLTGCASAYALSAAGLRVVLLEADRLAEGGTAGGTGVIVPQPDAS